MPFKHSGARWASLMQQLDFGEAHETVVSYLKFEGARPASEAAHRSRNWARDTCPRALGVEEYRMAIDDMLDRGLLCVIDEYWLREIENFIVEPDAIGPIEILPPTGTLQYSIKLVRQFDAFWQSVGGRRPPIYQPHYRTDQSIDVYSGNPPGCLQFISDSGMVEKRYVNNAWHPVKCGQWRGYWWGMYDYGFVLSIPHECRIAG
ncbi:hypothetical protein [Mariniblastus fucicola]|uniref:hypothetical protein n=1 Tax=Mariniblastus fucicola TaxID=980251 RepID=UPI0011DFB154|nr:hypothetical protein [Mariniblastus fucicola]